MEADQNAIMKQHIFLSVVNLLLINLCVSQGAPGSTNQNETRRGVVYNKIADHKQDERRVGLYRYYSLYFTDSNIYPNADAIDLVDAYNKEATLEDIRASRVQFKELNFVAPEPTINERVRLDSITAIKPGKAINDLFKAAIKTFSDKFKQAVSNKNLPAAFIDSLAKFRRQILPVINMSSFKIASTQMEFLLFSLNDINRFVEQLSLTDSLPLRRAVSEMMQDFFDYRSSSLKFGMMGGSASGHNNKPVANTLYLAGYINPADDGPSRSTDVSIANANVYVYTRGTNGKWDQAPKPNSYNVYYGANGLKYSLTPGCDTLSFFKFRPSVPASTLPVFLAKGSYCFVLQDINTHQIFLRPDLNLRDNQVIDNTKLIKLCFKVENH